MSVFSSLQNDTVYIQDASFKRSGPYQTGIGSKGGLSATIFNANLEVEEGWKLVRSLLNGKEEFYTILQAHYSQGLTGIPPHWTLKLQKDNSLVGKGKPPQSTTGFERNRVVIALRLGADRPSV